MAKPSRIFSRGEATGFTRGRISSNSASDEMDRCSLRFCDFSTWTDPLPVSFGTINIISISISRRTRKRVSPGLGKFPKYREEVPQARQRAYPRNRPLLPLHGKVRKLSRSRTPDDLWFDRNIQGAWKFGKSKVRRFCVLRLWIIGTHEGPIGYALSWLEDRRSCFETIWAVRRRAGALRLRKTRLWFEVRGAAFWSKWIERYWMKLRYAGEQ